MHDSAAAVSNCAIQIPPIRRSEMGGQLRSGFDVGFHLDRSSILHGTLSTRDFPEMRFASDEERAVGDCTGSERRFGKFVGREQFELFARFHDVTDTSLVLKINAPFCGDGRRGEAATESSPRTSIDEVCGTPLRCVHATCVAVTSPVAPADFIA